MAKTLYVININAKSNLSFLNFIDNLRGYPMQKVTDARITHVTL